MIIEINSIDEYNKVKSESKAALIYFSHEECNVCKILKPKIENLLSESFDEIKMFFGLMSRGMTGGFSV